MSSIGAGRQGQGQGQGVGQGRICERLGQGQEVGGAGAG